MDDDKLFCNCSGRGGDDDIDDDDGDDNDDVA